MAVRCFRGTTPPCGSSGVALWGDHSGGSRGKRHGRYLEVAKRHGGVCVEGAGVV